MTKLKTKRYNKSPYGSPSYKLFWDEQMDYCKNGITVNGYRLTGDNYF